MNVNGTKWRQLMQKLISENQNGECFCSYLCARNDTVQCALYPYAVIMFLSNDPKFWDRRV